MKKKIEITYDESLESPHLAFLQDLGVEFKFVSDENLHKYAHQINALENEEQNDK